MATHRLSIINGFSLPLDSNCFFAPYVTVNSGTTQNPMVLVQKAGATSTLQGTFRIPQNWVGTSKLSIIWTSETQAGDLDFQFKHRTIGGSDTKLLDTATLPAEIVETTLTTGAEPSVPSERMVDTITLTETDFVAGDTVYFEFNRLGAADTKADDNTIWGLDFEYNDV